MILFVDIGGIEEEGLQVTLLSFLTAFICISLLYYFQFNYMHKNVID